MTQTFSEFAEEKAKTKLEVAQTVAQDRLETAEIVAKDKLDAAAIIAEINRRLDIGDVRFDELEKNLTENTRATMLIAQNTAGMVRLSEDLESGTKFLCRCAMGVRFVLKEVIEPFWKPVLITLSVYYYFVQSAGSPKWVTTLVHIMGQFTG